MPDQGYRLDKQDAIVFTVMLKTIRSGNYIMVRFLDEFYKLSAVQQNTFVAWFHEKVGDDRWDKVANDRTMYREFVKALLMHYSGSDLRNEPTFEDLGKLIGEYIRSDECKQADDISEVPFMEQLEEL